MKKIYILTLNGVFSQNLKPWSSLDVELLKELFEADGHETYVCEYGDIKYLTEYKECVFLTSSSQNPERKQFIEDHCFDVFQKGGEVVPNIELLKAHENKGYQVLMSNRLGLTKPKEEYLISDNDMYRSVCTGDKFVVKTIDGAGSHGVALISKKIGLYLFLIKNTVKFFGLFVLLRWAKYYLKYYFNQSKLRFDIQYYYKPVLRTCKQEFLEGLRFDYKVIFFGTKAFYLKRYIRKNDFRASGSNLFEFCDAPHKELLDFAASQYKKFDTPYLSLDVMESNGSFYLIEFQSPHLGPYTVMEAKVCFEKRNNNEDWDVIENNFDCLEKLYVEAITNFIG